MDVTKFLQQNTRGIEKDCLNMLGSLRRFARSFLFAICHNFTLCEYSAVRPEVLIQLLAVSNSVTAKTGKFD